MKKKLFIGVLAYSKPEELKECLNSALLACEEHGQICVLQNGMSSNDFLQLSISFPEIKFQFSNDELGAAGGRNRLIDLFLELDYEYLMLLDSDVVLEPSALNNFFETIFYDNEKFGAMGFVIKLKEDKSSFLSAGIDIDLENLKETYYTDAPIKVIQERHAVITAALIIRGAVLVKMPEGNYYFDEKMFVYWEDVEWCLRLREAGFQNVVLRECVAYHPSNANRHNLSTQYYMLRNMLYLFKKNKINSFGFKTMAFLAGKILKHISWSSFKQPLFLNRTFALVLAISHSYSHRLGKAPKAFYRKKELIFEYRIYCKILSIYCRIFGV